MVFGNNGLLNACAHQKLNSRWGQVIPVGLNVDLILDGPSEGS